MQANESMATMPTMAKTADTLREARRRAMLTQGELSKASGVGITTIVRIERGQVEEPHFSTLRKLAAALEIDPKTLLSE